MNTELLECIADLLRAIAAAEKVGCINHLDCWDEARRDWYPAIERAAEIVQKYGDK